jgi:hypothetical protein
MSPVNVSSVSPHRIGWEAADDNGGPRGGGPLSGDGTLHQPGGDLGRKALDAYRYSDLEGLTDVITEYQDGYNVRTMRSGADISSSGRSRTGSSGRCPGLPRRRRRRSPRL